MERYVVLVGFYTGTPIAYRISAWSDRAADALEDARLMRDGVRFSYGYCYEGRTLV